MLLALGSFPLCLLVFLHCLSLLPGILLYRLLLLPGRFAGLPAILSDTSVFPLGIRGHRQRNAEGDDQYENYDSFHGFILSA